MRHRQDSIRAAIRERIISGLHLGSIPPGGRLPSARSLAREFGATPRTVTAAYGALVREGLVELRERSGTYVARPREAAVASGAERWLMTTLLEARTQGISPARLPELLRGALQSRQLRAVCVAGNADQLHHLCREVAEDYGFDVVPVDAGRTALPTAANRVDVIVTTALEVQTARRAAALAGGKPLVVVRLRDEIKRHITTQLHDGVVYFIGTDARFLEALQAIFGPLGCFANVRLLLLERDELGALPPDAAIVMMRSAQERLGDCALTRRAPAALHVFSNETARELLSLIVRGVPAGKVSG